MKFLCMLHGSETWPVRKENEVALQRAEKRMVRWICGVCVCVCVCVCVHACLRACVHVLMKLPKKVSWRLFMAHDVC